jgi:hypothetical protein
MNVEEQKFCELNEATVSTQVLCILFSSSESIDIKMTEIIYKVGQ